MEPAHVVQPASAAVRRAVVLLLLEAVALVGVGVVDAVATAVGTPSDRQLSYSLAATALATGVVLVLLARAVHRGRGWARSPAVVLQLLALPIGVGLAQGGVWLAAIPVLLLAGAALWHLFAAAAAPASD